MSAWDHHDQVTPLVGFTNNQMHIFIIHNKIYIYNNYAQYTLLYRIIIIINSIHHHAQHISSYTIVLQLLVIVKFDLNIDSMIWVGLNQILVQFMRKLTSMPIIPWATNNHSS